MTPLFTNFIVGNFLIFCHCCGTASEDCLTRQIVTNSKLLKLVIKAARKIQKGYYPANLKDEITLFSTTVTEKDTVDLHTDLPKTKVKNLDDFYATHYIVSFFALVVNTFQS